MVTYRNSIIGFHNPTLHKGLKAEEFLNLYVTSLRKKRFSKRGSDRARLAEFIINNWDDQIKFVKRLFFDTLV